MKKNILKIISFLIMFIIIFINAEKIFFDSTNVCPTWSKIQDENQEPLDILFMGNSHAYCSINPVVINEALGIKTAILGSSSQFMQMTLENLKIVLKHQKPKVIVLEMCAVIDSDKNRQKLINNKQGIIFDNLDGIENYIDKFIYADKLFGVPEALSGTFQILRPTSRWSRWNKLFRDKTENPYSGLYIEGYSLRNRVSTDVYNVDSVEEFYKHQYDFDENVELDDTYKNSLIEFLDLTEKNNVDVWLINAPIVEKSVNFSGKIKNIKKIAKNYKNVKGVIDFNVNLSDIGLEHDDFFDIGHLNRIGAEKFTQYLINYLGDYMNITPNYDNVWFYKNENIEYLNNGLYRYSVDTFSDSKFSFKLKENNKIISQTEFSSKNYIDIPYVKSNQILEVDIIPANCDSNDKTKIEKQSLTLQFIKDDPFKGDYNMSKEQDNSFKFTNSIKYPFKTEFAWLVLDDKDNIINKTDYSYERSFEYKFDKSKSYKIKCSVKSEDSGYFKTTTFCNMVWDEKQNEFHADILK